MIFYISNTFMYIIQVVPTTNGKKVRRDKRMQYCECKVLKIKEIDRRFIRYINQHFLMFLELPG